MRSSASQATTSQQPPPFPVDARTLSFIAEWRTRTDDGKDLSFPDAHRQASGADPKLSIQTAPYPAPRSRRTTSASAQLSLPSEPTTKFADFPYDMRQSVTASG